MLEPIKSDWEAYKTVMTILLDNVVENVEERPEAFDRTIKALYALDKETIINAASMHKFLSSEAGSTIGMMLMLVATSMAKDVPVEKLLN